MRKILTISKIEQTIKNKMSSRRYNHTLRVRDTAKKLAATHKIDLYKAEVAALLHDVAKEYTASEKRTLCKKYNIIIDQYSSRHINLLHGPIGASLAKEEYNIQDPDILNAIANHTLGREKMSVLEKIVYIADVIEPGRKPWPGLEKLRKLADYNLDAAMKMALESQITHLVAINNEIHPMVYIVLEEYKNIAHMEGLNETIRKI